MDTLQWRKNQRWTTAIRCLHVWISLFLCLSWVVWAAENREGHRVGSTTDASNVKRSTLPPLNHKDPFKDFWETPSTTRAPGEKKDKMEINERKLRGVIVPELRERLVFSSNGDVEQRGLYPFPAALIRTFKPVPCSPDVETDWPCVEEGDRVSGGEENDNDREKKDRDNDSKNPTRTRRAHAIFYGTQNQRISSQEGDFSEMLYGPEELAPSGYPPYVMFGPDGYERILEQQARHTLGSHIARQFPALDVVISIVRRAARDRVLREATKELVATVLDRIFDRIVENSPNPGSVRDGAGEASGTMGNRRGSGQVNRDGAGSEEGAEGEEAFNAMRGMFVDFMRLVKGNNRRSGDLNQRASWGEESSHQQAELHLPINQIRVVELPRSKPRQN